ncbi:MAG: TonB-dependent receptor [Bacteroidales bacterium]
MISFFLLFLFCVLPVAGVTQPDSREVVAEGVVVDKQTGELLPGATIYHMASGRGTISSSEGRFTITLPADNLTIRVTYIGYDDKLIEIEPGQNGEMEIALQPTESLLSEVVVSDRRSGDQVKTTEMGVVRLQGETIDRIPAILGETDVINALQMLPGVQSVGEGASGFNVRGGNIDQNLVLMDQATVYNASHLMGFFSVFNNDAVQNLQLHKGNIPAHHGGRLASLLNVQMKSGDMRQFGGAGGIGSISSRLMLEGPIVKDRISFVAAGRRSYADLFIPLANNPEIQNNKLYFYDINMKINARLDDSNRLQFSTYRGRDYFRMGKNNPFSMDWGNTTYSMRWNNVISDNWLLNADLTYSGYDYSLNQEGDPESNFRWEAGNGDIGYKAGLSYFPDDNNHIRFGISGMYHEFEPGMLKGTTEESYIGQAGSTSSAALSHALYISNEQEVDDRWSLDYGLRLSIFQSMGPSTVYYFDDNHEFTDSTRYDRGEIYNTWSGLEPRIGARYAINDHSSLKASYNRNFQYLHLASLSDGGNPLDIWIPSSERVKPQIGNQYAVGYFRNLSIGNHIGEGSIELFYKTMDNQIDFKDNAWLMLNPKLEGEFRFGEAWAYGAEFLVRKDEGNLTGWISYTWSRAERQIEGVNDGKVYPASYDRTHNLSVVMQYAVSPRVSLSANWVYTTGAPVTLPAGRFEFENQTAPVYSERNGYRLDDYHRLDLGATIKSREPSAGRFYSEWNISVYNAYYRKNTWMLDFRNDQNNSGNMEAYKVYLFPILPSVTYNFYF